MSKLDEILKSQCPKGVEFVSLEDVATVNKGEQLNKSDFDITGIYPVMNGGISETGFHNQSNQRAGTIAISQGGASAGHVNFMTVDFWAGAHCYVVNPKGDYLSRFLYFILKDRQAEIQSSKVGAGIPGLNKSSLTNLRIPNPPLEIQKEIVRILDTFTDLEEELEEELAKRKKQYEYYREDLFRAEYKTYKLLDEISVIWRGRRFVKDDIVDEGVPAVHYGEIYTKYGLSANQAYSFLRPELASKLRFAKPGDVVMVSAGETIEDIGKSFTWAGSEDIVIHDACYGIRSDVMDPRYLVHFFNTHDFRSQLRKYISSSKISAVSTEKLGKVLVPVPTLERQKQIVELLDCFDDLVSNLISGLPAEIAARRQQYEYYRNMLLSFKELKAS